MHSRLGEEEQAEEEHDKVADHLNPVDPVPVDLEGDPVGDERARRVGGEHGQDEKSEGRTTRPLRPEIGDDTGGGRTLDAGGRALDEAAEDERVDVGRERLSEEQDKDAAGDCVCQGVPRRST